ncbi:MAG TPA: ABC transporter permease [Acidimicrobiia bacterium]|nr:ABC transporter permease [Acidimicrobiia bacterium]
MRESLTGILPLVRLALRRDRLRLVLWVGGLVLGTVATAASLAELYATEEAQQSVAAAMNSPAGLAMTGPAAYLVDYRAGAMLAHQLLGFVLVLVGIMSVLIVVRHTRAEEESGVAELIRSSVVGRHAHLAAAVSVGLVANIALGLLMSLGVAALGLEDTTWAGALLYGATHTAVGLVFVAIAAVTAQVTEHPRAASGMGMAAIGLAYVLRALGDIGDGVLSWLSPIGWGQATLVFLDNRWWPLAIAVAAAAVLTAVAFELSNARDVGAGLRRPRAGRPAARRSLLSPLGLAFRLHRGLLAGWTAGMVLLGLSYGSVLADADEMLSGVDLLEEAIENMAGATVVESFASLIMMIMAVIGSIYVTMAALRSRSEEAKGRGEPLIVAGVSRTTWLMSHLAIAVVAGALLVGAAGLTFGLAGATATGDAGLVGAFFGASLAYAPALWLAAGVTAVLIGFAPRWTVLAWLVPVYGFVVGYLGQILQFSDWLLDLSPFGNVPRLPAQEMEWVPLIVLALIAAGLLAAGVVGFRRRDLLSTT